MPTKAFKFCSSPGCSELTTGRFCEKHQEQYDQLQKEQSRQHDTRRESASKRGYDSKWRQARLAYLAHHPLCVMCDAEGRAMQAEVVDHIIPHRGDKKLFWDSKNWQSLCKRCHDRKTASEDGGYGNK